MSKIEILDRGFVELQQVMGDDLAIVNAARISYLGHSKGDKADKGLLFFLMQNKHTSPFEMVEFKFHIKAPLFVARQWMRHRTWSYNEVSRRYTDKNIEFYIPDDWRQQSANDRQVSTDDLAANFSPQLQSFVDKGLTLYRDAIAAGVAREQARLFLPQCVYTEFIAKVDAHNLMHFLQLRLSEHAQYEMRLYAMAVFEHFENALPWTAEAFFQTRRIE